MTFLFTGDIVINSPENFMLSDSLKETIRSHDVRCCNFEAPIADGSARPFIKAGPNIRQSGESAEKVLRAGFNLVNLANNHIMDFGTTALQRTKEYFENRRTKTIGAGFNFDEVYASEVFTDGIGKTTAVLALADAEFGVYKSGRFHDNEGGYAWIHHPAVYQIITTLSQTHDILIIFVHAGIEEQVIPLPEWRDTYRKLIDWGADMVIASHPHIVQGYETYRDKKIFYSLGNFYFDCPGKRDNREWNRSIMVSFDTNDIENARIIPVSLRDGILDIDASNKFEEKIERRSGYIANEEKFLSMADEIAAKLWKDYYKSYYEKLSFNPDSFYSIVKYMIKRFVLRKNVFNETMLLHNIQISSHRWVVERYLYNKNMKQNKDRARQYVYEQDRF
jgi:poly-gamma-glutamate synthesis protein (capsule biosynthesis protein)